MVFSKEDKFLLIKIYKPYLKNIDIYDKEQIMNLFKKIFIKIRKKYKLSGLFEADAYVNDNYGMIIEISNLCFYKEDFDVKIKIHLDCLFLNEVNINEILDYEDVYYYKNTFYGIYNSINDKEIIYKNVNDIVNKGIKIY